jgi:predicted N-acyltransferase
MYCKCYPSIADIPASTWDELFCSENPFVQHAYLLALEESGCVHAKTGWQPQHMLLLDGENPVAALPLYAKSHSYGEFVFDWGWAEAYERYGLEYYPKLVSAIPYTPVTGPRVGLSAGVDAAEVYSILLSMIRNLSLKHGYSGWHLLFPDASLRKELGSVLDENAFLQREAVQFHWFNRNYNTFEVFLLSLRSSRRKNVRRERRLVAEQGISLRRKQGREISDEEWQGFYQCYRDTYRKRSGHDGYLNQAFFKQLRETMTDSLLLVVACKGETMVASSLFLFDERCLYGRYWGALEDISCLHFEACLYQGIEFCIEHGLAEFDPGTQGEHKLLRGFEPVRSASYHWIADSRFRAAIADFLQHEKRGTDSYQEQAETFLPFKKDGSS